MGYLVQKWTHSISGMEFHYDLSEPLAGLFYFFESELEKYYENDSNKNEKIKDIKDKSKDKPDKEKFLDPTKIKAEDVMEAVNADPDRPPEKVKNDNISP